MCGIAQAERTDVINHAKPLFNDTMNVLDKCQLIVAISGIAPAERTDVINHAKPLFNDTMNVQDKCQLIVDVGMSKLKEPMSLTTQSLSNDTMNVLGKCQLIAVMSGIAPAERTDVINHAKPLFNDTMNAYDKSTLIRQLTLLPKLKELILSTTQNLSSMTR